MGVVSTNVFASGNGSGSGSGGANGADLPTRLKSLSANGGNKSVTLTLQYENTNFITGVQVNYKTGGYPTSPSDGDSMTVTGAQTTIKVTGLTNKLTYYFRVFLFREVDGVKYYQTDVTNARITSTPRSVEITGATIFEQGNGYIALTTSQNFTLSAPAGTKITLGGGGCNAASSGVYATTYDGGAGGAVAQYILSNANDVDCSLTIGGRSNLPTKRTATTLQFGSSLYTSGNPTSSSITPITTKFGKIGAAGGKGAHITSMTQATAGVGGGSAGIGLEIDETDDHYNVAAAGGGGGGPYGGKGGNASIYNITNGGNGGGPTGTAAHNLNAGIGSDGCGNGGNGYSGYGSLTSDPDGYYRNSYYGGGGGGGFSGGGGGAGTGDYNSWGASAERGYGGQGVCVIEWNE